MRKNLIAMSVATLVAGLGLAGGAAASVIRDDGTSLVSPTNATAETVTNGGIGHQLIIPYYNVQGGNATLFNIVNTDTVNGKAVKVRFRGASNSDDVFDFQLFLSPGDVWASTLTKGADGTALLTTSDKSCTLPSVVTNTAFVTARLPAFLTAAQKSQQTREGYIEIFNMADIPRFTPTATTGAVSATANPLYDAIKHVAGVPPCTSSTMATLQSDPTTRDAAYALGFRAPSTGLFANFTIINVPKSGAATGEAVSIAATLTVGANQIPGNGNIVFFPQVSAGMTTGTTADQFTADPALRTSKVGATGVQDGAGNPYGGTVPLVTASQFDLPDLSTPYLLLAAYPPVAADPLVQAEALTRSLAVMNVINEYITDPSIAANTDWVFSLPTRRYSVALDYRPATAAAVTSAQRAFSKFVNRDYFDASNSPVAVSVATGMPQICVTTNGSTFWNREEGTQVGSSFVISPNPPAPQFSLCGEANVLTFNAPTGASVLGAEISVANTTTPAGFTDGWAQINTPGLSSGASPSVGGNGLPILGKAYVRATNTGVGQGLNANFGGSWEHRYQRPVTP